MLLKLKKCLKNLILLFCKIMTPEEIKKLISEYIKENLYIDINTEAMRDYGVSGTTINIKATIEGELISETSCTIYDKD